jgi:DNA-directed RNA polymerase specialized sigma24 family protein
VQKHKFPLLESRERVRKVLTTLVKRTLTDEIRKHRRRKRSPAHEQASASGRPEHLPDLRTFGPEVETLNAELPLWLDWVMEEVRGVHEKAIEIIELSHLGFTNTDIARQTGLGQRSVQLLKKKMFDRLQSKSA